MKTKSWYAHGKLLLTGEYLVLEGAKALAVPLKLGQYLSIKEQKEELLFWNAMKPDGFWFQAVCRISDFSVIQSTDQVLCEKLHSILLKTRELNPDFLKGDVGYSVETILEFNPDFGFGSSSTLIANLAKWAGVDPFKLQKLTFGGSGFDIACATLKDPIIYQLAGGKPRVEHVNLDFDFTDRIYFVYLGKKQLSSESIAKFRLKAKFNKKDILQVNRITTDLLFCKTIDEFEKLLAEHEKLLSRILRTKRIQNELFADHKGVVKSLGGWGGDFVLMTSHARHRDFVSYLNKKGFETFYHYADIVM